MISSTYSWHGGTETMLRFGPTTGPVVIAALPPFEEANRTRAFVITILRALAARGIATALPDFPGTGESLTETEYATLTDWQNAFSAAADTLKYDHSTVHSLAIRAGALLDTQADLHSRYRLSPQTGAALVRDLIRTRLAAAQEDGERFDPATIAPPGPPVLLAGNNINRQMLADLNTALPAATGPIRTVRLDTDTQPADRKIAAAPLWRRAEPDNDPALAALLADDIARWIAKCAA